ncbi:hypothetical protein [Cellulophaga baltica]|uniref:hypothetical protein n=1 Tax=Cellulophaga baltica TaxID=76594 RepID=UPI0015F5CD33|nr:hypothetical protein [Cellulophaga baltica]MBA6316037.1 hypothetical protein [Cellulophaga baltica]
MTKNIDSGIRMIQILRRIGSILFVYFFFHLLISESCHRIAERLRLPELKHIYSEGIYKTANVNNDYEIHNHSHLIIKYNFEENNEIYKNKYTLTEYLPKDNQALDRIFTVHYLKDNPKKNSLNIKYEISQIEKSIHDSSLFWLVIKILGTIILGLILITQIISFIQEFKDFNNPIKVPEYLRK